MQGKLDDRQEIVCAKGSVPEAIVGRKVRGEKCRDEWAKVNRKYQAKKDSLDEARFDLNKHEELEQAAKRWLGNKEEELRNFRQVRVSSFNVLLIYY